MSISVQIELPFAPKNSSAPQNEAFYGPSFGRLGAKKWSPPIGFFAIPTFSRIWFLYFLKNRHLCAVSFQRILFEADPLPDIAEQVLAEVVTLLVPQYHVVLLDDDEHTYDYVIEMLMDVFGHSADKAYKMACEVDAAGRVIVDTTHKDRAELKRDQIHGYGMDWRMPKCKGSMSATIEPAD